MLDPVEKSIEVACGQRMAFEVFLDMSTWWPREKFATSVMKGGAVSEIRVDARVGGKIVEVAESGEEFQWGAFRTYDPYGAFSMDFHIDHPDHMMDGWSVVEVTFTELAPDRTRVDVVQTEWDFLGDMAEGARGGYEFAWGMILGRYAERCA